MEEQLTEMEVVWGKVRSWVMAGLLSVTPVALRRGEWRLGSGVRESVQVGEMHLEITGFK